MEKYFIGKSSKFFVTDDNWHTFEHIDELPLKSYEVEDDSDVKYNVNSRYHLGDIRAEMIIKELEKIRKLLYKKGFEHVSNGYGDEFEVFAISLLHNLSYQSCIDNNIVLGSKDGKIDAVVISSKEVYVYQIKLTNFGSENLSDMRDNFESYMINGKIDKQNTVDLERFMSKHKSQLKNLKPIYKTIAINSSSCTPDDIYDMFFETLLTPKESNGMILYINLPCISDLSYNQVEQRRNYSKLDDHNFVFFMKATDLIKSIMNIDGIDNKSNVNKIFSDNVRGYLGINKDIESTIKLEPENFIKYNNGITITGEVTNSDYRITIINPVVINGQQTLTNLINAQDAISEVNVMVMIKGDDCAKTKAKIAQYTNSQKPVKPIDILSLNLSIRKIQKELLQDALKTKDISSKEKINNGYYLNIYQNGKKGFEKDLEFLFAEENIIELNDFIRLSMALETKNIGDWKNNPSKQIEASLLYNDKYNFNLDKANKVCNVIVMYRECIEYICDSKLKNDLKNADLAFQYILYNENLSFKEVLQIICYVNKTEKDNFQKLIDMYKSNSILDTLESIYKEKKYQLHHYPIDIEYYAEISENIKKYTNFLIEKKSYKKSSANTYVKALIQLSDMAKQASPENLNIFIYKDINAEAIKKYFQIIEPYDAVKSTKRKIVNALKYYEELVIEHKEKCSA